MSLTGKPSLTTGQLLANDGFWLDLDLTKLLTSYRIPGEYADDTIKWGLILALVNVNAELEPVKLAVIESGHVDFDGYLDAFPAETVGVHPLAMHYQHAVYARAKAILLQQFNSLNRRQDAEAAAKEAPETETWWLNQSAAAIHALFVAVIPDADKPAAQFGVRVALL